MKGKEARACHCVQCRSGRAKTYVYRQNRRQVRQQTKVNLGKLQVLSDFLPVLVGGVYTD